MNTQIRNLLLLPLFLLSACDSHRLENAKALFEQGKELETLQMPDSAIIIYQKAIKELKNVKGDTLSGVIYNRIGDVTFGNDLYLDAFKPFSEALEYNLRLKDKTDASRSLRGMGKSLLLRELSDSSIVYFRKALSLQSQINNAEEIALIYNNLSLAFYESGKFDSSLIYNAKASQLSTDSINIFKNYCIRADLFMQIGQYDSASVYYKLGYNSKNIRTQIACIDGLANLTKTINDEDSALYISIFQSLKDTIEKENKSFMILNKNKQFQLKEAQKAEKGKYIYYIIGILTLSLFIIFLFIKRHRTEKKKRSGDILKHRAELSEMQKEQKKQKEELKRRGKKEMELKQQVFNLDPVIRKIKALDSLKAMQRKKAEPEFVLNPEELSLLEQAIDLRFDNFAGRLRSEYPKLTDNDIHLCCLLKMKIPSKNIFTLLETNELALKKRRYRIKHNKMELSETVNSLDDFLSKY